MANNKLLLNESLELSYPDGFHVMDEEERSKLTLLEEGPCEFLTDPDRHMIISIGWKPLGGLTSLLLNAKDIAKTMKARIAKATVQYDFKEVGPVIKNVGGEEADGFAYTYKSNDIEMFGESLVIKHDKVFYYLHVYIRENAKEENIEVWNEILSSVNWL